VGNREISAPLDKKNKVLFEKKKIDQREERISQTPLLRGETGEKKTGQAGSGFKLKGGSNLQG